MSGFFFRRAPAQVLTRVFRRDPGERAPPVPEYRRQMHRLSFSRRQPEEEIIGLCSRKLPAESAQNGGRFLPEKIEFPDIVAVEQQHGIKIRFQHRIEIPALSITDRVVIRIKKLRLPVLPDRFREAVQRLRGEQILRREHSKQVRSSVPERGQVDEQKFKAGKGLTLKRREHVRKGLRIRFFEHRHEGKGGLPSRAFLPLRAALLFGCPVPEQHAADLEAPGRFQRPGHQKVYAR